ncbi:unnamed protein product [Caenorhabditis brenneri]
MTERLTTFRLLHTPLLVFKHILDSHEFEDVITFACTSKRMYFYFVHVYKPTTTQVSIGSPSAETVDLVKVGPKFADQISSKSVIFFQPAKIQEEGDMNELIRSYLGKMQKGSLYLNIEKNGCCDAIVEPEDIYEFKYIEICGVEYTDYDIAMFLNKWNSLKHSANTLLKIQVHNEKVQYITSTVSTGTKLPLKRKTLADYPMTKQLSDNHSIQKAWKTRDGGNRQGLVTIVVDLDKKVHVHMEFKLAEN